MTTTTRSRKLQGVYPPDFTHLMAEVADTAMKAIIEPDPTRYIRQTAVTGFLELRRLRSDLTPERRRDLAAAFRCDVVRKRVIRDLAMQFVEAYEQLNRAKNTAMQIAISTALERSQQKAMQDGRRDGTLSVHGNG